METCTCWARFRTTTRSCGTWQRPAEVAPLRRQLPVLLLMLERAVASADGQNLAQPQLSLMLEATLARRILQARLLRQRLSLRQPGANGAGESQFRHRRPPPPLTHHRARPLPHLGPTLPPSPRRLQRTAAAAAVVGASCQRSEPGEGEDAAEPLREQRCCREPVLPHLCQPFALPFHRSSYKSLRSYHKVARHKNVRGYSKADLCAILGTVPTAK